MPSRPCEHILATGKQCGAPALRKDSFCYWHTEFRRQQRELDDEARRPPNFIAPGFDSATGEFRAMYPVRPEAIWGTKGVIRKPLELRLGVLEDANSIQIAIARVLTALAGGRLENRRATLMLYGLQLALSNCRALTPPNASTPPVNEALLPPDPITSFDLPAGTEFHPDTFQQDPTKSEPGSAE